MLFNLAISLILAGFIMLVVNIFRYYRDHRCPTCNGSGIIPLWDGSPAGCPDCDAKGYIFNARR